MASFWSDFYERGLGGAGGRGQGAEGAQDGRPSASSALATVRAVDREAEQLHRDLQRFADSEAWKKWAPFYNEWQLYRAIHAPRDAATDPDLAISNARRFATQIFTWRSELDRARAQRSGGGTVGSAAAPESRSAWKPLAIIAGCVVVAMGGRYVWLKVREGQRERAERERLEARQALLAQAAGALVPGVQTPPMLAAPGYYPMMPPYYGQPFAVMPAPPAATAPQR